jgi:phosphatidylglycerol lysyltransferase
MAAHISLSAPAILLALSAVASMTYLFTLLRPATEWMDGFLPIDPADANPAVAVLSGVGLAALTIGLLRGKSVAWWLAIATLSVSLLGQARALSHPLVVIVIGGLLAVLLADRRRYIVESAVGWRRVTAGLLMVGGLIAGLETSLIVATTGGWPQPLAAFSDITAAIGNAFGMSDATASRAIADKYGCGALLPFQLGEDKLVFSPPDADGLVVYGMAGRTVVVLGDLIGPPEASPQVFERFLSHCRRLDREPVVYQASSAGRATFVGAGFRIFKVGEEAIVDLATFDTTGNRRANLRHTITRCRKDGVTFRWFAHGISAEDSALLDQLEAIDDTWRKTAGPAMGFTISHFDRAAIAWQPVSVAIGQDGAALGFTTFGKTGVDGGWVLDLMRRDPAGPPGVVEASIAEAAVAMRDAGAKTLSLGLAPLAGLDGVNGPWEERLLASGGRMVHRWYDVQGLARFKNKFDPYWIPRYGAIRHRRDLIGFIIGLLRVHLAGAIHLPRRHRAARRAVAA